jgi:arginine-tRNA-protein transferase
MHEAPRTKPLFFYTTAPLPCPYIEGRQERKVVVELSGREAVNLHDELSRAGFRRSHGIAYTPACPGCNACLPLRVVVEAFDRNRSRSFRRIWSANSDISVEIRPALATAEQYRLFARYQDGRHGDGDMASMSFYDYQIMIEDTSIDTFVAEFRDQCGVLRGVCLLDRLGDGFSAVYSFYDVSEPKRGFGSYMVLWGIEEARRTGRPYVYLGYWIRECRKMSYKTRFGPCEALIEGVWERLDEATGQ